MAYSEVELPDGSTMTMRLIVNENVVTGDSYIWVTGSLTIVKTSLMVDNIQLTLDGVPVTQVATNEDGVFGITIPIFLPAGEHELKAAWGGGIYTFDWGDVELPPIEVSETITVLTEGEPVAWGDLLPYILLGGAAILVAGVMLVRKKR